MTAAPDFVIVGSGAAGGVIAKELAVAGFRVVVLEQGPYLKATDFHHDELATVYRYALTNDPKTSPTTFRKTAADVAKGGAWLQYGRLVGGGTAHFTANYWRFHESDFVERSKHGAIAGTAFADWPLTYDELEPYYTKVEWDIGVSGQAGVSPFDPPRSKPYPMRPLPVKSSGVLFERGAKRLGWHPFPAPMAITSEPYQGRLACQHCGFCEFFGCEFGAKSSTLFTVIPRAEATGRCEIRSGCYVFRVDMNRAGRTTGVTYYDARKRERHQPAKAVILCCNGAETPRLLLMSASSRFPQGLANSSGLVGKHLMFTGWSLSSGVFEEPLNEFKSVLVTRVLHDFYESDPARGFYGGGGLDARLDFAPIGFALSGLPPDVPRWGAEYKRTLRRYFTRTMNVASHSTSLPLESNSISLDPATKDAWGLPALRVTYRDHPDDLAMMRFLQARSLELLAAAGAQRTWSYPITEQTGSNHLLGTCRMGTDAAASVVDPSHRTHDVPNLFICDGSSFVTSGRGQPTCTIQALAYRAADHIARLARAGEIPAGS
jgi:choline dehydrogenase-like flavoprotein